MSISAKIQDALNAKLEFETDEDDPLATYKALVPSKIALYFVRERDGREPIFGYYITKNVNETLRNNLKIELGNCAMSQHCNDIQEAVDDAGHFWINCEITTLNDSIVDWVVATMEEVERRALFLINR